MGIGDDQKSEEGRNPDLRIVWQMCQIHGRGVESDLRSRVGGCEMTIQELMNKLESMTTEEAVAMRDSEEVRVISDVLGMLTPLSQREIQNWQEEFLDGRDATHDWEGFTKFVVGQNGKLLEVLRMELSEVMGVPVRMQLGMEPLNLDSVIRSELM